MKKSTPTSASVVLPVSNHTEPQPTRVLRICRTIATLFSWYCISAAIILCTKWLFTNHFSYPLTVTTFSNTIATAWAFLMSRHPAWRPEPLTRKQFREYVLPIGIATALEIGFSNIALKLLTVSFGTILKGGSPIFTMFWGLLFRVETFSSNLCLSLATIALGIALASFGEGQSFALTGFILQLLATALGGLRWAMTHVLLRGAADTMPPLTAVLYTSPTTALCVLPFAAALEGPHVLSHLSTLDTHENTIILGSMLFIASLVFVLLISEYWLVIVTSSLALSVAGVFKELLTIAGGIIIFSEHISFLNVLGFIICQLGIFAYMYIRYDPNTHNSNEPSAPQYDETDEIPLTIPSAVEPVTVQTDTQVQTGLPT